MGRPPAMEAVPQRSVAEVIVAMPLPSSMGKKDEITTLESLGGGVHGSPAWSELEEDEGAMLATTNVVAEPGG
jgi:hypothetical protein